MTNKLGTFAGPVAYAFISETVDDSAAVGLSDLGFTDQDLVAADVVFIYVESNDIRWRIDGDLANDGTDPDPTTSVGFLTPKDKSLEIWGRQNIRQLRIISALDTATLQIQLSRYGGHPY